MIASIWRRQPRPSGCWQHRVLTLDRRGGETMALRSICYITMARRAIPAGRYRPWCWRPPSLPRTSRSNPWSAAARAVEWSGDPAGFAVGYSLGHSRLRPSLTRAGCHSLKPLGGAAPSAPGARVDSMRPEYPPFRLEGVRVPAQDVRAGGRQASRSTSSRSGTRTSTTSAMVPRVLERVQGDSRAGRCATDSVRRRVQAQRVLDRLPRHAFNVPIQEIATPPQQARGSQRQDLDDLHFAQPIQCHLEVDRSTRAVDRSRRVTCGDDGHQVPLSGATRQEVASRRCHQT